MNWTLNTTKYPEPHAKYLVKRDGWIFVATPCYGMHAPWWVAAIGPALPYGTREVDPVPMLDTDEWVPLTIVTEVLAIQEASPQHASAPDGYRCADCTIDGEPCPRCYTTSWRKRHPNVTQEPVEASPQPEIARAFKDDPNASSGYPMTEKGGR